MHVNFVTTPRGGRILEIDDARILPGSFRNFEGRPDQYTREGDRSFSILIPDQETADALMGDENELGVGWNVKIKEPREEGDEPFRHLKVKVKFNGRGPNIYLVNGDVKRQLDEESVAMLDEIDIDHADLDIRPYDGESRFGPHRTAYLQNMQVYMRTNRFAD